MSLSPYPRLAAPLPYRPESEAPPSISGRPEDHPTDPDELTDPETPMAIDERLQTMDRRLDRIERTQQAIVNELQRHTASERAARLTHGALPWAALLVALLALAVSVYRMGQPTIMTIDRVPVQGVSWM